MLIPSGTVNYTVNRYYHMLLQVKGIQERIIYVFENVVWFSCTVARRQLHGLE